MQNVPRSLKLKLKHFLSFNNEKALKLNQKDLTSQVTFPNFWTVSSSQKDATYYDQNESDLQLICFLLYTYNSSIVHWNEITANMFLTVID